MAQDYVTEPAQAKIDVVADLKELNGKTQAWILTDYRGLSVFELTELRKKLRAVDAEFRVVKNTLFKLSGDGILPVGDLDVHLAGPTAIGFAKSDAVGAAKVLVDYAKEHKAITVKAGCMDGKVFGESQVVALSKTPPKEVLIAQMMGSLNAPITGLVGTLNGILSNFVFTVQAIADKKAAA